MKCSVCGMESGKYPLCKECNKKKENGEIIKCQKCQCWHYANKPCEDNNVSVDEKFLYELKKSMVTKTEEKYLNCIKEMLSDRYIIQVQANLASFINRTDSARYQNELYRNVDFIITDLEYRPLVVVEVNDQTHLERDRHNRDEKVYNICEEAGIPVIKLWTKYGVNEEYIKKRINETLESLPVERIHHFESQKEDNKKNNESNDVDNSSKKKNGCYIATCVYGSYDCPQVWLLRRFRDDKLRRSVGGRCFIKIYYLISPLLVNLFGEKKIFKQFWRKRLDYMVENLKAKGIKDTPYKDAN